MERRIEHFQLENEWRMVSVLDTVYSRLWAIVWAWSPFHHRIRYCNLSSFSECGEVPRKMGRDRQEILSVISPSMIQQQETVVFTIVSARQINKDVETRLDSVLIKGAYATLGTISACFRLSRMYSRSLRLFFVME